MAEDDEIDIVGDFSFNSCFAQNNQGIPSCSDREDTVHPQWLLDAPATNWYDVGSKRRKEGPSRKLSGNNSRNKPDSFIQTVWSSTEKDLLVKEMSIHGRDVDKISKSLKTKSKAEIQALIEAEYGIVLDTPHPGVKTEEIDNVPAVVQEEIIADVGTPVINMNEVISMVTTAAPTVLSVNKTKPNSKDNLVMVNPSEILYEDDLAVASTEFIKSESSKKRVIKKERGGVEKKMGNHRRKGHANVKWKKQESPKRVRKDSSMSDDSTKNPKMHIVFSSGQALPVSEGEEVIKIEKKKESECESDIEVDIDSDNEHDSPKKTVVDNKRTEIVTDKGNDKVEPGRKFEPMPKRKKKINLGDGGGGYTIMHTAAGDLFEVRAEPRRERAPRTAPVQLYPCRVYNADKPAPFSVHMGVSCLVCADAHAHTSRAEVAGLLGGAWAAPRLRLTTYARLRASGHRTCCDADPVSQAEAAEKIRAGGELVVGWHHSHPQHRAAPSATDLRSQRALQALPAAAPAVALITSQRWPVGRRASVYRCFRVEGTEDGLPAGYSLPVTLEADVTRAALPGLLRRLRATLAAAAGDALAVRAATDVCPLAQLTYLEKLISSVSHHMRSAGYADGDPVVEDLITGIRDIFR